MEGSLRPEASPASPHPAGSEAPAPAPGHAPRGILLALLALLALVLVSVGLHLVGLRGDLPYPPDVDEPMFLRSAVRVAARGSLDPGWVGHPASTVIYPLAALLRLWHGIFAGGPLLARADQPLSALLASDPTPLYLIGRGLSAAYGVASIVITWLIARRLTPGWASLVAPAVLATSAIAVAYGTLLRSDTAGLFWALVTIWLILRAVDRGRLGPWLLAGAAIGLAVSSRYFYVALAVPFVVGVIAERRPEPGWKATVRRLVVVGVAAGATSVVVFAITSPYVLLDASRTIEQLQFEAREVHPGADGLSPAGNAWWYLTTALPAAINPVVLVGALAGVPVALRHRPRVATVIAAFALSYLLAVSASHLHWDRYVIPLLPVIGMFLGAALAALAGWITVRAGESARSRRTAALVTAGLLLVALAPSVMAVASQARSAAQPSTRATVTDWIRANIPAGAAIAHEISTTYLDGSEYRDVRVFALPDKTLDAYRADGVRYLVSTDSVRDRFTPDRDPAVLAAYEAIDRLPVLVRVEPAPGQRGAAMTVYELPPGE